MSEDRREAEPKDTWDLFTWAGVDSPWTLAEEAVRTLDRVCLWGPPGIGKSFLAANIAKRRFQVTLSSDLTVQELMGHYLPEGNVFQWHYGPVSEAFRKGGLLVLSEVCRASGAVLDFLLAVLDSADVAVITLPNRESMTPGADFKVIATSNSPPDTLDPALRSRFEAEIHLPGPHPGLTRTIDRQIDGLGRALADSFLDPERAIDPRRMLSFARLVRARMPPRRAALLAFGERAPDVVASLSARGVDLG